MTGNRERPWSANVAEDDDHACFLCSAVSPGDDRTGWDEYDRASAEFMDLTVEVKADASALNDEALIEEGVMVLSDLRPWSETKYLGDGALALVHGGTGERSRCGYVSIRRIADAHASTAARKFDHVLSGCQRKRTQLALVPLGQ